MVSFFRAYFYSTPDLSADAATTTMHELAAKLTDIYGNSIRVNDTRLLASGYSRFTVLDVVDKSLFYFMYFCKFQKMISQGCS